MAFCFQLHDLFKSLSCADESDREPIPPSSFLNAVSRLNPMFEGNQQQDAHELFVLILSILGEVKIPSPPPPPPTENGSTASLENGGGRVEVHHHPVVAEKKTSSRKKVGKLLQNGLGGGGSSSSNSANTSSQLSNGSPSAIVSNGIIHVAASPSPSASNGQSSRNSSPAPPSASTTLPNFVKENFVGKSVMRMRCLECEASTFCTENFTYIDVPLQFEDPDEAEDLSPKDLFLKQIMMSETLRENNKYWCEECSRLNEAQRSVHFEALPKVMMLQLHRFTAAVSSKNYMSKINDYIPTPFTMSCFCTQCMPQTKSFSAAASSSVGNPNSPKHYYRLYAVIMHLGATLASGHYIAYVRASEHLYDYLQCQRGGTVERNKNKKGIMKFLRRSNDSKSSSTVTDSAGGGEGGNGSPSPGQSTCRSGNCCGIRSNFFSSLVDSLPPPPPSSSSSTSSFHQQRSIDSVDSCYSDAASVSSTAAAAAAAAAAESTSSADDYWLECDDETIQLITRKHFEEILGSRQGATTPYLLFYQKL